MTRYPKSGKGKKWTALELKAVPLAWRGDMLSDGDGLTGEVRVVGDQTISIHFKFAFKWNGKVAWHYCGTWPALSMEQIRRQRDEARDLVRSGVNPNDQKKAERIENQAAVEATLAQAAAGDVDECHAGFTQRISVRMGVLQQLTIEGDPVFGAE